jgi:hypothetical protein
MVSENQMDSCLPCQNNTIKNPQTHWRCIGTGTPPLELAPPSPGIPPVSPCDSERSESSKIEGVPPSYVYIHTSLPSAKFFNLNVYTKDRKHDTDCIPDLLTGEGPSTG